MRYKCFNNSLVRNLYIGKLVMIECVNCSFENCLSLYIHMYTCTYGCTVPHQNITYYNNNNNNNNNFFWVCL